MAKSGYNYKVGELKRLIAESSQEFSPVLGPSVKSDNKKNNEKSYKDAEAAAKNFDGGLKDPKKVANLYQKPDANRTTIDYNPRVEPDKEYKDKVNAQMKGYTSKLEEDNGIEKGGAEFDNEGKIAKQFKDAANKKNEEEANIAHAGLKARELPKIKRNQMCENLTPKRLIFKHTRFINEAQMLARIPEEYKKDGQKIYMKDSVGNEYIVECEMNTVGSIETNVRGFSNKEIMNEQISRIQELMNYKSGDAFASDTKNTRIDEDKNFSEVMNLARGLIRG